jgi:hypothetical protein
MSEPIKLPQGLPEEAYRLGEPLDEFSLGAGRAARKLILSLLLVVLGLGALGLIVLCLGGGGLGAGRAMVGLALVSVALIVTGIFMPVGVLRAWGTRVLVCRCGLIYLRRGAEVVRWDDVEVLWCESASPGGDALLGNPRFRVRRRSDGREFVFSNFLPRVDSLGYFIEKKTLAHLLPPARAALDAGEVLAFGPLALSRFGVRRGKDWLYWSAVRAVSPHGRGGAIVVSVGKAGPARHNQPVEGVPNYHVFLEIVRDKIRG